MELFPERLVSDLAGLPGGSHAFLKQICGPDAVGVRRALQGAVDRVGPVYEDRAVDLLGSLDNTRFFQGFAEVASLVPLLRARWRLVGLQSPGPRFELRAPDGRAFHLSVFAFLFQTRPGAEAAARERLVASLQRVTTQRRFVVAVRRWLPHDLDPEPVRRAVEMWLRDVAQGRWQGRYASYEDEHLELEFALTGETVRPGMSPVAFAIGPVLAHRTLEVVEPRVVRELDRYAGSRLRDTPLLVSCVADQPWALTPGYLRDFLYGRPMETVTGPAGTEERFGDQGSVSLFRDPLYAAAAGVMFVDRRVEAPTRARSRVWLNPWSAAPLRPEAFDVPVFAEDPARSAAASTGRRRLRVLRWASSNRDVWELG